MQATSQIHQNQVIRYSLPFITEQIPAKPLFDSEGNIYQPKLPPLTTDSTSYKKKTDELRRGIVLSAMPFLHNIPFDFNSLNLAELKGARNYINTFGPEAIKDFSYDVFHRNCAGQNLASLALQISGLVGHCEDAFEVMYGIHDLFTRGPGDAYVAGLIYGNYLSFMHKIYDPNYKVEYKTDETVDISSYKNIFPYRENENGRIQFDFYDPESQTGHEVKFMESFLPLNGEPFLDKSLFRKTRQLHKYIAWLEQDSNRKLEFHLMNNAHSNLLRLLKKEFPKSLQKRVTINLYTELDYFRPIRRIRLKELNPKNFWHDYYKIDLDLSAPYNINNLKKTIINEIQSTIVRISNNPTKNYFNDSDTINALVLCRETLSYYLSNSLKDKFLETLDQMIDQWKNLQSEIFTENTLYTFNAILLKNFLEAFCILLQRKNATALIYLIRRTRTLLVETRPYIPEYEEFGIFYPLAAK